MSHLSKGIPKHMVLVMCKHTKNHQEEPLGIFVAHMFVTYWDGTQEVWSNPPHDVWRFCFESTVAQVMFTSCARCK